MRVTTFKAICKNPELAALLGRKSKIRTKDFVKRIFETPEVKQEKLFRSLLACLYDGSSSSHRKHAERLFTVFIEEFEHLPVEEQRRNFSDSFHKELQKVKGAFAGIFSQREALFEAHDFKLKDLEDLLPLIQKDNYLLAGMQEDEVNRCSFRNDTIRQGLDHFQKLNDTAFPYSVVQLPHSPKMVIIGQPRHDREKSLSRFFAAMIKENVDVIVALNTPTDWEEAIAYHEKEHVEHIRVRGYSVKLKSVSCLYEGLIAANIPLDKQRTLAKLSEDAKKKKLASEDFREYRPRLMERTFLVTDRKTGDTRTITQLHYENWPDKQEAPDLEAWWILLTRQLELHKKTLAVHCQGGIGRTNAHAVLTSLVSHMNALKREGYDLDHATFNVPFTMYRLKEQAPRLGGFVAAKRFGQIYEMLDRYYKLLVLNP